jgi:hypothetical protein
MEYNFHLPTGRARAQALNDRKKVFLGDKKRL